jgi:hypothetical protein
MHPRAKASERKKLLSSFPSLNGPPPNNIDCDDNNLHRNNGRELPIVLPLCSTLLAPQPPVAVKGSYNPPKEGRRDDKRIDGGDGNENEDVGNDIANVNPVYPHPPHPTLLLLCGAVVIGGIPPSTYLLSGGDNGDNNKGMMADMASFLVDQLRSYRDDIADGGSNDNADNAIMKEGRSYVDNLDNELLSLLSKNDNECNMVEVNELLAEDIANMLLKRSPTLHQVRGGYVMPMMSMTLYPLYLFKSMSLLLSLLLSFRGGGVRRDMSMGESQEGRAEEEGSNGTNKMGGLMMTTTMTTLSPSIYMRSTLEDYIATRLWSQSCLIAEDYRTMMLMDNRGVGVLD